MTTQPGNKTQYAILGALSIHPMSGYEIKKMMESSTNYFWTESNGQLYPTLAKLAKAKLVTVEKQMLGAKLRKVYSLTQIGKKKLQKWLTEDVESYPQRNELLLKIFYGQNVIPEISTNHIKKYSEKCEAALKIYQNIETKLEAAVKKKEQSVYCLLTVKAGVKHAQTELEWCHEAMRLINRYTNQKIAK
ncbi:MAG: PadR family transcriptional regulator [Proteobacteria bacterium]|nr:PadR family transcriptional regulator [Pseudomonadota bacterium]